LCSLCPTHFLGPSGAIWRWHRQVGDGDRATVRTSKHMPF